MSVNSLPRREIPNQHLVIGLGNGHEKDGVTTVEILYKSKT